jgi:hypothetical protein
MTMLILAIDPSSRIVKVLPQAAVQSGCVDAGLHDWPQFVQGFRLIHDLTSEKNMVKSALGYLGVAAMCPAGH